jgi:hypothetical protein
LVDDPSQQDLARVDRILLRQRLEDGVQGASSESCDGQLRTVRSKLDVLRFVVGNEIAVLQIWMIPVVVSNELPSVTPEESLTLSD